MPQSMKTRPTRRAPRAFTLIEALIAIVLVSVAVPSMLWAVRDAISTRANPILASRARWLAAEKLEDVIADRNSPNRGYSYIASANYAAESTISGFTNFSRSVSISETDVSLSTAGTGYKTVTVTVSYTDGRGASRSFTLATVLTDYTP